MSFFSLIPLYFLPFIIVPIFLYLVSKNTKNKKYFPSNFILKKILNKKNIRKKNLIKLIIRLLIIIFLIFAFMKPKIILNKIEKKDLYVDISHSSLRFRDKIKNTIEKLQSKNLVKDIYLFDTKIYKYNSILPKKNYKKENYEILPKNKNFILISDFQKEYESDTIIDIKTNIKNCSIYKVELEKRVILPRENNKFQVYIHSDNNKKNINKIKIFMNDKLWKTKSFTIKKDKKININFNLSKPGFFRFKFVLNNDEYKYDNKYFYVINAKNNDKKYYINKKNKYIENLMRVLHLKNSNLNKADFVFLFIKDSNQLVENKILDNKTNVFIFPKKSYIFLNNYNIEYGKKFNKNMNCYFTNNNFKNYNVKKYYKLTGKNLNILSKSKNNNMILQNNNLYYFAFDLDLSSTNFMLQSYFYNFFRNIIYKNQNYNYFINSKKLKFKKNINSIYFNGKDITGKFGVDSYLLKKIHENGVVKINNSKNKKNYYSINTSNKEFNYKPKKNTDKISFESNKKYNIWHILILIVLLLVLYDLYLVYRDRVDI